MPQAALLLAATTLTLLAGSFWPRQGEAAFVAVPPGMSAIAAFAAPGWRIVRITRRGGLTFLVAAPDSRDAEPATLRHAAQGWLVLRAASWAGCTRN